MWLEVDGGEPTNSCAAPRLLPRRLGERLLPDYVRRSLPIGNGAVEGAYTHVVSDRFKGGGMRWKLATAEPLLQLRAAL